MTREVFVGKTMYAIFSNAKGLYVNPCKVTRIAKDGFYAECHNGGETGHGLGTEFFPNNTIGNGVYFSKDSATLKLKEIKKEKEKENE